MPTYEYQCEKCHRVFEVRQRISEPPLATCDVCGGAVKRLLSPAPFILKGEGWYVTDYPSEARKKAKEAETPKTAAKTDSKPADSKTADSKPVESKPAESSGTKGAASPAAPAKSD
ncbi:MAG TPA: zinc ribbon domain-containing protein [Methylomirabilota bacterium]|nr:zinc ribbon domain-containing protein [Methylomirabilota bacterium]